MSPRALAARACAAHMSRARAPVCVRVRARVRVRVRVRCALRLTACVLCVRLGCAGGFVLAAGGG